MATFFNTCPPQQLPTTDLYVLKDGTVARELPKDKDRAKDAIHIKAGAAVRVNDALADALHKANLEVDDNDTRSWEFEYNLADPDHVEDVDLGLAVLDKRGAEAEDARKGRVGLIANDDGVIGTVGPKPGEIKNPKHEPDPAKVREDPADPASKPAS